MVFKNLLAGTEALTLLVLRLLLQIFVTYCRRVILPYNSILSQHSHRMQHNTVIVVNSLMEFCNVCLNL